MKTGLMYKENIVRVISTSIYSSEVIKSEG